MLENLEDKKLMQPYNLNLKVYLLLICIEVHRHVNVINVDNLIDV